MKFRDNISKEWTDGWTHKPKPICSPLFHSWGHNNGILQYGNIAGTGISRYFDFPIIRLLSLDLDSSNMADI